MIVNTEGLHTAKVLAVLYNFSRPQGAGMIAAASAHDVIDAVRAEELLHRRQHFDYLGGRPLKVDLSNFELFDASEYDHYNGGEGAAQEAIEHLRSTGSIDHPDGSWRDRAPVSEGEQVDYEVGTLLAQSRGGDTNS